MCLKSMVRSAWIAALVLVSSLASAGPRPPAAAPVFVLSLWTDDADDQADALTQALRAQMGAQPGWSVVQSPESFETLAIALRCPQKPDAACLQRIGDQVHADHYVWGTVSKLKPARAVANVHLWTRGKAQTDATATYADSLTDPNDPALRAVALRLVARLTGTAASGTLIVHAGDGDGLVVVDGQDRGALHDGVARLDVDPGEHTITVRIPGAHVPPQTASVASGAERRVEFDLGEAPAAPEGPSGGGPDVRKIAGYSTIAAGAVLLAVSGFEIARWASDKSESRDDRENVPRSVSDVCTDPVNAAAGEACAKSKDATTASAIAWTLGAIGVAAVGTGVWLVVGGSPAKEPSDPKDAAPSPRLQVLPALGRRSGALDVRLTF